MAQNSVPAFNLSDGLANLQQVLDQQNSKYVYALKQLQLNRIRAELDLARQIHDLEADYQAKLAEFDVKRKQIVLGEYEPTEEECVYEFKTDDMPVANVSGKGIPNFWPIIFRSVELLSGLITERDDPALDHLIDVRCNLVKNPRSYVVEFEFSENEFFTNKVLTKTFVYSNDVDLEEPLLTQGLVVKTIKGCTIDWKSNEKNLTVNKVAKKVKHKDTKQVKTIEKEENCDSFFNFFQTEEIDMETSDEDSKELGANEMEIGSFIRDTLVPRAVLFFTGEAIENEDYDEELDDEDFDDDDEDDDDGLSSDEEEQDSPRSKGKQGRK